MTPELIGSILGAAADVISHVVELTKRGKEAQAREAVERFVAATGKQLDDDRAEAEAILDERFPGP